jgi:hypothetical protein
VASGCSTAMHNSVASGGLPPARQPAVSVAPAAAHKAPSHEVRRLAMTGLPLGRLAGDGVLSLVLGCLLLGLANGRKKINGETEILGILQHGSNTVSGSITALRWNSPTLDQHSRVMA